jgi:hypothetical protein
LRFYGPLLPHRHHLLALRFILLPLQIPLAL